jgi:hypothetical protein
MLNENIETMQYIQRNCRGIYLADYSFGHNKSWLLLTPKFYNLFSHFFIIFLNSSSLSVFGILLVLYIIFVSENVIDPILSHIYDPLFQVTRFSVTSSFSCRFSVFQDPYSTWIPISYLLVHHISHPCHFTEMSILWKFFCVSFRGKCLKFSLLHHTSSDVKNEWCYISSHICLRHVDRYTSSFVLFHISDWRSIFYYLP